MSRKILVAIDASRCARQALDEALREAGLRHATLEILHVIDYGFLKRQDDHLNLAKVRSEHVMMANALLERAAKLARDAGIDHSVQLIDDMATLGDVSGRVVQYAQDSGAELVVAGTHGHTGLLRVVLGSVAEELVRHCPVPVLVIREGMNAPVTPPL
ncbi:MAG: universal stress protein UspA [Cupriavidus sp.]|jgi:nucleotide-binding universal stress UspA family protein|uniref:universal stress protein n=1 Tax=Cupriavidus TaxID=106589 RepID=UPI000C6892B3|nr:universal stress protein [Cupriavidus pauculus]MBU69208.1 universal stress protein UspA [Cupriavidus sp.]MCM3609331.1 universal stress protein [Cupriavidus pauculus]